MANENLILDRYQPLGQAGTGGFGTVQVAWDPRIQRKVAIKSIRLTELDAARAALPGADAVDAHFAGEAGAYELPWEDDLGSRGDRAVRGTAIEPVHSLANVPGLDEARTAAMLSDPRIVTVYDFEVRGQTAYLIMEFVEGLTLTQVMHVKEGMLSLDAVTAVFRSVSGALQAAHDAGVLHLDIKPDNILINEQGQVKVTDFGLATLADAAGLGTTGGGTIGYMPLEQMRREHLDARTDEWSLASVTYEMLTGRNPFLAPALDQAEGAILNAELVMPSLMWDDLDPEIDDVLLYALDPERENRYESVADFAEELSKFLGDARQGREELATIVSEQLAAAKNAGKSRPAREEQPERKPIGEVIAGKLSDKMVAICARAFAAVGCAFLAYLSVVNMPFLADMAEAVSIAPWVVALVAAAIGAIVPFVGVLVAYLLLAVSFFASDSPVLGVILIIALGLWWYFVGRFDRAPANVALSEPLFGAIGGATIAPMAAGAFLTPVKALGTGAFVCVVALLLGSLGSESLFTWNAIANWHYTESGAQARLLTIIMQPQTWCAIAGWTVGPLVGALVGQFDRPIWNVLGVVLTAIVLLISLCAGVFFTTGFKEVFPPIVQVLFVVVPAIVLCLAITVPKPEKRSE